MNKYIPADKLLAEIERRLSEIPTPKVRDSDSIGNFYRRDELMRIKKFVHTLQQEQPLTPEEKMNHPLYLEGFDVGKKVGEVLKEQPANMIQWTGQNLREVVSFTGKSPKFGEYFKSWEEFEQYVHAHGDIFKLFFEDGSHYEVPVGAWIVKTPDGYNVPSVARFVHAKQEKPEVDLVAKLKHHLATTPKEQLEKEWKELEPWGNIGPTVQEFLYGKQPEVDLEKELNQWRHDHFKGKRDYDYSGEYLERKSQLDLARHFYELGLNARKDDNQ